MRYTKLVEFKSQYLHQDGSPSVKNANLNGSVTPIDFVFDPTSNEAFIVRRILIFGLGSANVSNSTYVDLATLTNGLTIKLFNTGGEVHDITDGIPIQTNDCIARLCYDGRQNIFGANNKSISARYTLARDTGDDGLLLDGSKGEKLVVTINDDLTGLSQHFFRVGCKQINI